MLAFLVLAACARDDGCEVGGLLVEESVFDLGSIAIGDEGETSVVIENLGSEDVRLDGARVGDETWQVEDVEGATVPAGSYFVVTVTFLPEATGRYTSTLEIWQGDHVLVVTLRAIAADPCGHVWPKVVDLGSVADGGYSSTSVVIENCGDVRLQLLGAASDALGLALSTPVPVVILPGSYDLVSVSWISDGEPLCTDLVLDTDGGVLRVQFIASDDGTCTPDLDMTDDDGDGLSEAEGDCDDTDSDVHWGAVEVVNGVDDDCDGLVDENSYEVDDDGDGYTENDTPEDCNDHDPWTAPGFAEMCDLRDNDCDGSVDEGATCDETKTFALLGCD